MLVPHRVSEPAILYFGTPVALISTQNEDGSANLAPMSSIFWLGWRGVLGLDATSKTTENMLRTGECVLNLPSVENVIAVDRLARLTGRNPVPEAKQARGYSYEKSKFETAGLTPMNPRSSSRRAFLNARSKWKPLSQHIIGSWRMTRPRAARSSVLRRALCASICIPTFWQTLTAIVSIRTNGARSS